ncbi:MAG: alpha/beta hydrolase [Myxococcota bacterium]
MVRFALTLLWVMVRVAVARVFRGPLRSSWSFGTEVAVETLRALTVWVRRVGLNGLRAQVVSLERPPAEYAGVRWERVDVRGIPGVWFTPEDVDAQGTILYLHGGGYVTCSIETHRELMVRLARASRCRVLAVDYRLAPAHPFPAALDDAVAAYQFLLDAGVPREGIFVAGDSAGGGLTLALLMTLRDRGVSLPRAAMCISPWTDLAATGATLQTNARTDYIPADLIVPCAQQYAGTHDLRHPLISPLYGEWHGLPPLLIQVGGAETLLDDSRRVAERARAAGVSVTLEVAEDMFHVWHAFAQVAPQGKQAIKRMGDYVRQHLTAGNDVSQAA